jgi:hypothetical protein
MRIFLLFLAVTCASYAQDANVVQISKPDADAAKQKYEAFMAAKSEWEKAEAPLEKKYRRVPEGSPEAGDSQVYDSEDMTGTTSANLATDGTITFCSDRCPEGSAGTSMKKQAPEYRKPRFMIRRGFEPGITFTPDFRFAVPKKVAPVASGACGWGSPPSLVWTNAVAN